MDKIKELRDLVGEIYSTRNDYENKFHELFKEGITFPVLFNKHPCKQAGKIKSVFFKKYTSFEIESFPFQESAKYEVSWLNHSKSLVGKTTFEFSSHNIGYYGKTNGASFPQYKSFLVVKQLSENQNQSELDITNQHQILIQHIHNSIYTQLQNLGLRFSRVLKPNIEQNPEFLVKTKDCYQILNEAFFSFLKTLGIILPIPPEFKEPSPDYYQKCEKIIRNSFLNLNYKDLLELELLHTLIKGLFIRPVIYQNKDFLEHFFHTTKLSIEELGAKIKLEKQKVIDKYEKDLETIYKLRE